MFLFFSSIVSTRPVLCAPLDPYKRTFATKVPDTSDKPEIPDKPIDYLQSPAASWKAQYSSAGLYDNAPWQEMWSILFSVTIFMVYFCILREENDIDERMKKPLYDMVPGLEEQNLLMIHKYNIEQNVDNKPIETRMRELGMDVEGIRKRHYQ